MSRSVIPVIPLVLLGLGCGGATSNLPIQTVALQSPAAVALPGDVVITQVVEARPAAMRTSQTPGQDLRYSVLIVATGGVFVNGQRVEGQTVIAGDKMRIGGSGDPRVALGEWARAVSGAKRVIAAPDSLTKLSGQALGVADGTVIIPVLDELDVVQLSSSNSIVGVSSSETGRTQSTVTYRQTSGAVSASASTPTYANVRMRLLVLRIAGGEVRSRRVVYGRGAAVGLEAALVAMNTELTRGLQDLDAPWVAPMPAPVEPAKPEPITPADPTTIPTTPPTVPTSPITPITPITPTTPTPTTPTPTTPTTPTTTPAPTPTDAP